MHVCNRGWYDEARGIFGGIIGKRGQQSTVTGGRRSTVYIIDSRKIVDSASGIVYIMCLEE